MAALVVVAGAVVVVVAESLCAMTRMILQVRYLFMVALGIKPVGLARREHGRDRGAAEPR